MSPRHFLHSLLASRGYSVMTVVRLAIGLAAVGITFAVVDTVLLRPLPFAQSDRVVTVSQKVPFLGSGPTVATAEEFESWQKSGLFESAALMDTAEYTLEGKGHPERIYGASVTPEFFKVFGLHAVLGRGMAAEDAASGHGQVIVLSHQLWARRFASDRGIVGKKILLSGVPMVVIGVMPAGFDFPRLADVSTIMNWAPEQAEFWVPFVITPELLEQGNFNYYVLGKLREGVTRERAAAQFRASAVHMFKQKEIQYPQYRDVIEQ
ncbi:MAG: ABC transporter permease, partial [Acidobacteriaceae bacterium]|nr:ABC transporter permease [Acidobacteriaceae bacterium]